MDVPEANRIIIATLDQREFSKGRRSFRLFDNGTLLANFEYRGLNQEESYDVGSFDPRPSQQRFAPRSLLVATWIFSVPMIGFCLAALNAGKSSGMLWNGYLVFAAVFLLIVGVCWFEYKRNSHNLVIFTQVFSGRQLLFLHSKPTVLEAQSFFAKLASEIQRVREMRSLTSGSEETPLLSTELARLAMLKNQGILTEEEFQQLKGDLLKSKQSHGPIGFHVRD